MGVVPPVNYADIGDVINYTLVVRNDGNVTLTGVTVTDNRINTLIATWPDSGNPGHYFRANPLLHW